MTDDDWHDPRLHTLQAVYRSDGGQRCLMVFHAGDTEQTVRPPAGESWRLVLDTVDAADAADTARRSAGGLRVAAYSLTVWTDGESPGAASSRSPSPSPSR